MQGNTGLMGTKDRNRAIELFSDFLRIKNCVCFTLLASYHSNSLFSILTAPPFDASLGVYYYSLSMLE